MTDDRKPRQFYIADDYDNGLHVEDKPTEGFDIKVIELEPTLQLMKEMGEAMSEAIDLIDDSSKGLYKCDSFTNQPLKLALEKYRKFLEWIEK